MADGALATRPMVHQIGMTGETDVARLLQRHRLLHRVAAGSGAAEMCLTSVIRLDRRMTQTAFSVHDVVLAVTRGAVPVRGEGQRLSVTGRALDVGVPAVSEGHVTGLGLAPHGRREPHRYLVRRPELRRLMALPAR